MEKRPISLRILTWLPGFFLLIGLLALAFYRETEISWLAQISKLSFAFFLIMPAIYLLIRPELTITMLNITFKNLFYSKWASAMTTDEATIWIKTSQWKQLKTSERVIIYSIAGIALLVGGYILIDAFRQIFLR